MLYEYESAKKLELTKEHHDSLQPLYSYFFNHYMGLKDIEWVDYTDDDYHDMILCIESYGGLILKYHASIMENSKKCIPIRLNGNITIENFLNQFGGKYLYLPSNRGLYMKIPEDLLQMEIEKMIDNETRLGEDDERRYQSIYIDKKSN